MGRIHQLNENRPVLAAAAVFLSAGLSIASVLFWVLRLGESSRYWAATMAITSPVIFLCACSLVFFRRTLGYILGAIAGLVALPWFVLTESSAFASTWTFLNGADDFVENVRPFGALKILSVALIVVAMACAFLRLLPSRLSLRNSPLSRRTWPAIALAIIVLGLWLHHSAMPWMVPGIVDRMTPDLSILHVEKRGLQFHETSVSAGRGSFQVTRNDRRLLQYRFENRSTEGVMPAGIRERANALAQSTALHTLRTAPPIALRSWNAEGWYVATMSSHLLAFTSEYGTNPPTEIKDVFEQIENLRGAQTSFAIEDVCLGFCYDPVAGLGFWYWNNRCHTLASGTTTCR